MQLTVSGLRKAPEHLRFKHLFGRYVLGFKPWTHCDRCFHAERALVVHPEMRDGVYPLHPEHDLFYLCGVGQPERKRDGGALSRSVTNVHLAVRRRLGSTASIGSVYGATFTISDAEAIPIDPLPDDFEGLPLKHARCRMFQFGYQTFHVTAVGAAAPRTIERSRRNEA